MNKHKRALEDEILSNRQEQSHPPPTLGNSQNLSFFRGKGNMKKERSWKYWPALKREGWISSVVDIPDQCWCPWRRGWPPEVPTVLLQFSPGRKYSFSITRCWKYLLLNLISRQTYSQNTVISLNLLSAAKKTKYQNRNRTLFSLVRNWIKWAQWREWKKINKGYDVSLKITLVDLLWCILAAIWAYGSCLPLSAYCWNGGRLNLQRLCSSNLQKMWERELNLRERATEKARW